MTSSPSAGARPCDQLAGVSQKPSPVELVQVWSVAGPETVTVAVAITLRLFVSVPSSACTSMVRGGEAVGLVAELA